jgi:hypothetical protein
MANVTVTLDDALLDRAREEAGRAGKSLSRYLADLILAEDERLRAGRVAAMDRFLTLAKSVKLEGEAWKFDREEIYDDAFRRFERRRVQSRFPQSKQAGAMSGVAESAGGTSGFDHQPPGVRRGSKRRRPKTEDRD